MHTHHLTFFCELEKEPLQDLFADAEVIDLLKDLDASVSLGLLDLSQERARVVQQLSQARIPVTAWLLLPKDQGYWFNLDNFPYALQRYEQLIEWTHQHQLKWDRIGLDIEPDIQAIQEMTQRRQKGIVSLAKKVFSQQRSRAVTQNYQNLVERIRSDGYPVESYQFPLIIEERRAGSRVIQRLTGVADLQVDREVLMLYSSFMRPQGEAILASYAPDSGGIGIGITGGGVELGKEIDSRPLCWEELRRDLLIASSANDHLYIFSLEGCVKQGYLKALAHFDWSQTIELPLSAARKIGFFRRALQTILYLLAHPFWIVGLIFVPFLICRLLRNKK